MWQILKKYVGSMINIKEHPELIKLLNEGETLAELKALSVDAILLRWMNHHLKNANHNHLATNFSEDVMSGEKYTILLN